MLWVGVCRSHRCVRAFHDPDTLTPQESLALRQQYESEGLEVSLVPARRGTMRVCTHGQTATQPDLFQGVTP